VSVGTYHSWCDKNIACNAFEWLKCIAGANMVITDTFHGTIASAITNRPVAIYYSKEVNSSKMFDLVQRLGLESRMLNSVTYEEIERVFSQEQDMSSLNQRIVALRAESYDYIYKAINSI
jgi:polysaccharide pyruvyl transferase WcaK-like protein